MILKIVPDVVSRTEPVLMQESDMVTEAARLMRQRGVGAVLVGGNESLAGIFTERDVSFRVIAAGLNPDETPLGKVMTPDPKTVQAGDTVLSAMERMAAYHFRHFPVYEGEELIGVVALRDILANATKQISRELVRMSAELPPACRIAGNIMRQGTLVCLESGAFVRQAAEAMRENNVSAVLITRDGQLTGIFTERDVSFRVVSEGLKAGTRLGDVMSKNPVVVSSGDSCDSVVEIMKAGHFRHLPIEDEGKLAGILSIRDLYAYMRHKLETHFENAMVNRTRDMISFD